MQEQLKKATAEKNKAEDKAKGEEAAAAKAAPVAAPTASKPKGWSKLRGSIVKAKSTTSMDGKPENVRRSIVHAPAPATLYWEPFPSGSGNPTPPCSFRRKLQGARCPSYCFPQYRTAMMLLSFQHPEPESLQYLAEFPANRSVAATRSVKRYVRWNLWRKC